MELFPQIVVRDLQVHQVGLHRLTKKWMAWAVGVEEECPHTTTRLALLAGKDIGIPALDYLVHLTLRRLLARHIDLSHPPSI